MENPANAELLIENLVQAAAEYENNCDRLVAKTIRVELEKAKQAIRDALVPAPAQGSPEPVAWRWRFEDQEIWRLHRYRPPHADDSDVVCEPLYAAQPPAAPVETDAEMYRLRDLIAGHIACEEDCKKMPSGCGCALTAARAIVSAPPARCSAGNGGEE